MSVRRQLSLYKPQIICYNSFAFRKKYAPVAQLDRVTDSDVSEPIGREKPESIETTGFSGARAIFRLFFDYCLTTIFKKR